MKMLDKKKVIKGLEICYSPPSKCEDCPYHDLPDEQSCNDVLCLDALAMLKEQEPIEPINSYGTFRCGNCGNIIGYNDSYARGYQNNYCSDCGRKVKWDD